MTKKYDYTIKILLGIIVVLIVLFGIYISTNKTDSSDKDFKILSIEWNDNTTEYNSLTEEIEYTNQKIDWDNLCSLGEETSHYSIQTEQTGIFGCEYAINGITQYYENYLGETQKELFSFEEDGISTAKGVFQSMSPNIDNEFKLCCDKYVKVMEGNPYGDSGYEVEKTGERICDSIILPAKCS